MFNLIFYVHSVAEGSRTAYPAKGPSSTLPCPASLGSEHSLLPAEPAHAYTAPHTDGEVLERVLHQRQVIFASHDGKQTQ